MEKSTIAFIGTGLMGAPMARNLLKASYPVHAWNRTPAKAEILAADGATIASSAAQAVENASIVISILSDGPATGELLFESQLAVSMKPGTVFVDMASTRPVEARDHAARLEALGIDHVDAPVSGGTRGAAAATLAIMAGGRQEVFAKVQPVLSAMGRPVHVGPHGAGQLSKLANQAIVAATIGIVAEATLLAREGGADPAAIRQALKGGFADSIILQQHGERMTTGDFEPGGVSRLQLKDINNVMEEAASLSLELPLTAHMQERYRRFVEELDGADKDHSGIYLELLNRNGLC